MSGPGSSTTFDQVREKIRRFFNFESNRLISDLAAFDRNSSGVIVMGDFFYYLDFVMLKLSKEEQRVLMDKFHAVNTTPLSIEYLTSMIFYGRANMTTLASLRHSEDVAAFLRTTRQEMNLHKKGSFGIFQDYDSDGDRLVSFDEFMTAANRKLMGLSNDSLKEVFASIVGSASRFSLQQFRSALYGKELDNLSALLFKIEERLLAKGKSLPEYFFANNGVPEISFDKFAESMLAIDNNLRYDEVDVIYSKLDGNCDGKVTTEEFAGLMESHTAVNDFKRFIVEFAQEQGRQIGDVVYINNINDGMSKDEFIRLARTISKNQMPDPRIELVFSKLDADNNGIVSKIEMSEIYDLSQRQLFNNRQFLTFRNSVITHCEQSGKNLRDIFRECSSDGRLLTREDLSKMAMLVNRYEQQDLELLKTALDKNLDRQIEFKEFKAAMIGNDVDADALVRGIKRVVAAMKVDVDAVMNKFDQDRSGTMSQQEFYQFIKALSLRVTFAEQQVLFDSIRYKGGETISREEIFNVLFTKGFSGINSAKIIETFKQRVESAY